MKNRSMITIFQVILLFMMVTGLKNHVIIIPALLKEAGRDAWITVVLMMFMILPWGILILYIYRSMKGEHIHSWLERNIGRTLTRILLYMISLYLIFLASVTLKEMVIWTNVSYLLRTPAFVLALFFIIPCVITALTSFRTIIVTNFILLIFVVVFGFFVAFTNMQFKDYALLRPFLEHGMEPVMKATVFQGSGMVELIILLFLQHRFESPFRYWHFLIIAFILTGLTLGPLIGAIVEFGPVEAASQRYPAFDEWGLARLGKYIEHVDYLSIYQWLGGALIRISLFIYLARVLLQPKSSRMHVGVTIGAGVLILLMVTIPFQEKMFFSLLTKVFLPTSFWFLLGCSLFFGMIAFISRRKERVEERV